MVSWTTLAHLGGGDWRSGSEREHIYENQSFLISFGKKILAKEDVVSL